MPALTAKGQITLKRELLQYMGIASGLQLGVSKLANGVLALHAKAEQGLEAMRAACPNQTLSLQDMDKLIAQSWAENRS